MGSPWLWPGWVAGVSGKRQSPTACCDIVGVGTQALQPACQVPGTHIHRPTCVHAYPHTHAHIHVQHACTRAHTRSHVHAHTRTDLPRPRSLGCQEGQPRSLRGGRLARGKHATGGIRLLVSSSSLPSPRGLGPPQRETTNQRPRNARGLVTVGAHSAHPGKARVPGLGVRGAW